MSVLPDLFKDFETPIQNAYDEACADAQTNSREITLILADKSHDLGLYKSEFAAIKDPSQVRITWNGIASLWACAHGIAIIMRPAFEAQRDVSTADQPAELAITPKIELGLNLFQLSLRIAKNEFKKWVDWAPQPTLSTPDEESRIGNWLFFGALGWVMRHELAHHILNHHDTRSSIPEAKIEQEREADSKATEWLKSRFRANNSRPVGAKPQAEEIEFERRALTMFVGLVWLIQFECIPHARSTSHPDAADRLSRMLDILDAAEDSFAAEILSYSIKTLIDPEGIWQPREADPSARDAAYDALIRLNRHIQEHR